MPDETTEPATVPVTNTAGTHVWLRYPATGGEWECPRDVADLYVRDRGWEYMAAAPDTTWDNLTDQTGFDPAEHTVPEVNEHLEKFAEVSPGEANRVLELEKAGQNRSTVIDPLPDPSGDGDN